MSDFPKTVVHYFCPKCGRERPHSWGPEIEEDERCYGEWHSNTGAADHKPTRYEAVEYVREAE